MDTKFVNIPNDWSPAANMIFIRALSKMILILRLRGSTHYKQSMLSVDSSALHVFIENIVKLYTYVSDEIKLID